MSTRPDDEMSDSEMWQSRRARSIAKRHMNREQSAQILARAGIAFETRNSGAHLMIKHEGKTVNFWPGTGKWADGAGASGRGVFKLLKHLGVSA